MLRRIAILAGLSILLSGCGGGDASAPQQPGSPTAAREETAPVSDIEPPPAAETAPAPGQPPRMAAPPAGVEPVIAQVSEPTPAPARPEPKPAPAPPSASPAVVDPGGPVEVAAGKPGLTRIGAEKCKLCHKVQFASWAESAHARREPPLDCESCHGPGSEYKTMSVMKDPDKARAAGLVTPGKDYCVICHRGDWSDELLARTHAHKGST